MVNSSVHSGTSIAATRVHPRKEPPSKPMQGQIDSLNASVAAGVLAYEIVRQRMGKK